MEPETIRRGLEGILPHVERPGRYLGLERNQVVKEWDSVAVRLLLAFPDEYGIGMSHQGTRILYHIANRREDTLCERAFAPWPDMAAAMRRAGIPLYSLESYRPAAAFDLVGITLQSELNFVNIPYLLDLAGIPRWATERGEGVPLVVAGGPCLANPEPVAPFFDLMAVGDGEVLLPALLDLAAEAKRRGWERREVLRRAARIPGIYVPSLYRWRPGATPAAGGSWEVLEPDAPFPVQRVFVERLDPADTPERPLAPAVEVVQDRLGMEVVRGCTQGCRFCQAGFWYRPVREHDPETVLNTLQAHVDATGYEEVGLLALSSADYSQIGPLAHHLAERLSLRRVGVSLPSLRADSFSVALAESVSRVRKSGFTFAPETGSDRLRRVINKNFTNADMIAAAEAAFSRGWNLIKVYAMIGLPTETDQDLLELGTLTEELLAAARRVGNRRAEVKVSVGPFIPKSWTPFQWEPFVPVEEMRRRIFLLRDRFARIRHARLSWGDPEEALLEAVLSRGDRRLATAIAGAYDSGALFDGWREWLRLDLWQAAFALHGIDPDQEAAARDLEVVLPWHILDAGVRTGFLKAERRRALAGHATPDCRWGECMHCGIPGDGAETRLALATLSAGSDAAPRERPGDAAARTRSRAAVLAQPERTGRVRFTFAKTGDARWLSHRNVMDLLERALRAAEVPTRYTEGFNPHIRLSMGPALSVGHETLGDHFDVECHGEVDAAMVARANEVLPAELELTGFAALAEGARSLGKAVTAARYRILRPDGLAAWPEQPPGPLAAEGSGVLAWQVDGDRLTVTLNLRQTAGPTPGLRALLAAVGIPPEEAAAVRVVRESLILDGGSQPVG